MKLNESSNHGASKAEIAGTNSVDTSSADGHVTTQVDNGVARIEFFHPKSNSLPGNILAKLAESVTSAGVDESVRVIVLSSKGASAFCAGASFDELTAVTDATSGQEFFTGFSKVILAMIRAPKFVVSRVHGKAAGGAVGLIAASDYSFALRSASAKLSELAVGIGPFVVGPVIERAIGPAPFRAMAVDATWRDAEWCERHGLYSRIFDDVGSMDSAIDDLAKTLSESNPEAMAQLKHVFWQGTEGWDMLLDDRAAMSGRMVLSDFTRNAISKFRAR